MEFVSIAAFYMVEPLKFLVGCADFTAEDELDVVEGGEGGVGEEDAIDVAAVPGSKVGQDQGAGADLKGGVLAVDVDEIDGKFDGDAQAALRVAVGAKGIEQGVVEGGFDQGLAGIQLDWMGNLLQADACDPGSPRSAPARTWVLFRCWGRRAIGIRCERLKAMRNSLLGIWKKP